MLEKKNEIWAGGVSWEHFILLATSHAQKTSLLAALQNFKE
jgi:hypothetical protein